MDKNVERMLSDIFSETLSTAGLTGRDSLGESVISAISQIPRDQFVPESSRKYAFDNGPLPIGHGQTVSQPFIVALMTDLLNVQKQDRILEIGTGSGYQSAILSKLCSQVYSVELINILSEQAEKRFQQLGLSNIKTFVGNGYLGLPEYAPFDGIIVTAAATHIPDTLVDQLKPQGRLVIPVGEPYAHQELVLVEKNAGGEISKTNILPVAFVPLRHHEPI